MSCPGFFRVELHCEDLTGHSEGGPNSRCDGGRRIDLELWRDTGSGFDSVVASQGDWGVEVAHARVEPGRWLVEVRHAAGAAIDYALTTTYLPAGNCVSSAWICQADAQEIAATETSCKVLPSGSSCPSNQVYTQWVDLPEVSNGQGGSVAGFAVHAGAGEIRNVGNLTA